MPRPKPPLSEIQLAANRANAAHSTGPRTSQGKARSAQNARKHGFTASTFAVVRLETGLFTTCLNEAFDSTGNPVILMSQELAGDGDIEITRAQNRNYALAEGFRRCVDQSNSWSLLIRYQVQAERHYRRAIEEFERLKALRPELPNEPILDLNPNEKQPLTPAENEPISAGNPAFGAESGGPPAGRPPEHCGAEAPVPFVFPARPRETRPVNPASIVT